MQSLKKSLVGQLCIAGAAHGAWATGMESLEAFVKNVKSGRAEFTQTVTAPAKEGQAARSKVSTGTFEFQRPGRSSSTTRSPSRKPSWPMARPCGCTTPT
jgi:outer membrane lipoprotein carrier protein